jgi:hypothetical protein
VYAIGILALLIPPQSKADVSWLEDSDSNEVRVIAAAKPELAPYGRERRCRLHRQPLVQAPGILASSKNGKTARMFVDLLLNRPGPRCARRSGYRIPLKPYSAAFCHVRRDRLAAWPAVALTQIMGPEPNQHGAEADDQHFRDVEHHLPSFMLPLLYSFMSPKASGRPFRPITDGYVKPHNQRNSCNPDVFGCRNTEGAVRFNRGNRRRVT